MAALDDLAHRLDMNALEFFKKNIELTGPRANIYMDEFPVADELMGWSKRWHPRGDKTPGPIKHRRGMSMHTCGGGGHQSERPHHPADNHDDQDGRRISAQGLGPLSSRSPPYHG
jgi:hypothetical protein